ncbi:hypothetical protein [Acidovorax sp. SUPP2539]|uniref:hypothetical protein n=1 Tax=Acidovorax sp. SUPP2539 TaxID=2920878 RepID=UPI0023DE46EC|nr:hypothetical protein [Acidovorax sp. SUPP2539]GKS91801.1 hypothetical protein AVTE2539_20570 [Acidovorax sp. SUPP2539]
MTESDDPIANLAFAELIITCQADGCFNLFQKSLDEPATDPVEKWSVKMAGLARMQAGAPTLWEKSCVQFMRIRQK